MMIGKGMRRHIGTWSLSSAVPISMCVTVLLGSTAGAMATCAAMASMKFSVVLWLLARFPTTRSGLRGSRCCLCGSWRRASAMHRASASITIPSLFAIGGWIVVVVLVGFVGLEGCMRSYY